MRVTQEDIDRHLAQLRHKAERDAVTLARLVEYAHEVGLAEGFEEGYPEALRLGELIGRIRISQQLLKHPLTPPDTLLPLPEDELRHLSLDLEQRLHPGQRLPALS